MTESKTDYPGEQRLVDERHRKKAVFWTAVYQHKDIFAFLIRQRHVLALNCINELSLPKTTRALEIGCGAGFMAIALAEKGFTVEAIDSVPEMIELTRVHAEQAGVDNRIEATMADAHELAFQNHSFDLIVALGVTSWLPNLRKALIEIARVLTPGGYVVLSVDNQYCLNYLFDPLMTPALEKIRKRAKLRLERAGLYSWKKAEQHFYSIKEFGAYLQEANLTNIKNTNFGFGPFTFFRHDIFPDRLGLRIHQKLQEYADSGFPILRSTGLVYIVLAEKQ